jgi:5-deoxy-glucuronate isomerase
MIDQTPKTLLWHYAPAPGYQTLVSAGKESLTHLNFGMLGLAAGQTTRFEPQAGHEAVLTILTGALSEGTNPRQYGGRNSVFDGPTDTWLLSSGSSIDLHALTDCEIAVAQVVNPEVGGVQLYPAAAANLQQRGQAGWQREVRTYLAPVGGTSRLIVGETINAVGQWSSFPPHKHDVDNLPDEAQLEEIYLFKIDPPTGFAFQGLYSPEDSETANRAFIVRNNDVMAIPRGYHPVAATPGHRVYYYWVLAGKGNILKYHTEDRMRWLEPGL